MGYSRPRHRFEQPQQYMGHHFPCAEGAARFWDWVGAAGCETKMCHNFGGTHLADIFPTRAEMCHKNSRTSPAERRPKSITDPECVTNVSRMCQECVTKKLSPKVRFGKSQVCVRSRRIESTSMSCQRSKAASQSLLMRRLP